MTASRTALSRTRGASTLTLRFANVQPQDGNDEDVLLEDWQSVWDQNPNTDIAAGDTIAWRGITYEVIGGRERWRSGDRGHTKFTIARRSRLRDTVVVKTRIGDGRAGPVYSDPLIVSCAIDDTSRLVKDADGDEQVASATLRLHPVTTAVRDGDTILVDPFEVFTPEASLTVRGRQVRVLTIGSILVDGYTTGVEVTTG